MASVKKKFKRAHKRKFDEPFVKSWCEAGGIATSVFCKDKNHFEVGWVKGITIDEHGLSLLDEYITWVFKQEPWETSQDLTDLTDIAIEEFLRGVKKVYKKTDETP